MPRPRNLPRARLSSLRAGNPSHSAKITALLRRLVNSPHSYVDLVDAHLACRGIDQPLHVIICFRASGAAIGADRGRVGEDAFCRHLDQWRLVHAERIPHRVARRRAGGAIGSADIAVPGETHRKEITLLVERQFGGHLRLAPVRVRDEATGALIGPLDRAAKLARRVEQAEILRHVRLLHAERTADPIGHYAHLVATDAEHTGDVIAETEDALAADMQCKMPPRRVVFGKGGTRLDRVYDDSVAAQFESRDMSGAGKGLGDRRTVAEMEIKADVLRHIVIQSRPARRRGRAWFGL